MQLIRSAHKPDAASKQPSETFTGTVHMDPVFVAEDKSCMGNNVCFTPGKRTRTFLTAPTLPDQPTKSLPSWHAPNRQSYNLTL